MDALKLKDVILVGHSSGCWDALAYFRAYGTENASAFVCIDQSLKAIVKKEGDWGRLSEPAQIVPDFKGISFNRLNFTREFIPFLVTRELNEAGMNGLVDMVLMTPDSIALLLNFSANVSNFALEGRMIDGEIPVLYVLADEEGSSEVGQAWLAKNMPNTKVAVLENTRHLVHWEFPDRFNAAVNNFLQGIEQ